MRTERAPTTALSGKNISDDSLAISTANFAAPYTVLQPESLDGPGSPTAVSEGSKDGEPVDKAIELDEALRFLALEWVLTTFFFVSSIGVVGKGDGLFIGIADGERFLRM